MSRVNLILVAGAVLLCACTTLPRKSAVSTPIAQSVVGDFSSGPQDSLLGLRRRRRLARDD